ncbi:MAG: helicase-associated domain-containing protein [Micrococcales bacterium]
MSDQLRIAGALRKLSDSELVALAGRRNITTTNLRDFFDFAEQLASEKSVRLALATLPISALTGILDFDSPKVRTDIAPELLELMLVDPETAEPFATVSKLCAEMAMSKPEVVAFEYSSLSVDEINRDARMHIFELLQAITEVALELEQRFIREVGKRSIGLPEVKRLAAHLTKDASYAKKVFEIALWSKVATIENSRWQLGPAATAWLDANSGERWQLLAERWIELANPRSLFASVAKSKQALTLTSMPAGENFAQRYGLLYWQKAPETLAHIETVGAMAEAIGLTAEGAATSWFETLMSQGVAKAAAQMAAGLPQTESRLIVQADLSLIAPNPLPTSVEVELRSFVETEKIGLASLYRLSQISVSSGLESGLTVDSIRTLLINLSGKSLPQPVEYLLSDAERKFSKIRISLDESMNRSLIAATEKVTLTELHSDVKLRPLSLHFGDDGLLISRFDPDVVYFSLREAGYVAVRIDSHGSVISPKTIATPHKSIDPTVRMLSDIERMREADARIGSDPDDGDLVRQLQLAIKLKSKISVTLNLGTGQEMKYVVEPTGLANGRLRAKDRNADVERTLPLSAITALELL